MKALMIALFTLATFCILVYALLWPVLSRPDTQAVQWHIQRVLQDWAHGDNGR